MTYDHEKSMRLFDSAIAFATAYKEHHGHLPIIFGMELYEFFGGERVEIVEANVFNEIKDAEVTIQNGYFDRKLVLLSELGLRPMREGVNVTSSHKKIVSDQDAKNYGSNAGIRCDTDEGPCACGAWH